MIESFALHARGLADFFYTFKKSKYASDAFAFHFFASVEAWQAFAPEPGTWLRSVRHRPLTPGETRTDRFGEEIAHLNYNAPTAADTARGWPIMQVADEIGRVLWAFVTAVEDRKVCADFKRRATSEVPVLSRLAVEYPIRVVWTQQALIRTP